MGNQCLKRDAARSCKTTGTLVRPTATLHSSPVRSILQTGIRLQPKLRINKPGDVYEQEADRVADLVMRMPAPSSMGQSLLQAGDSAPAGRIQRACAACARDDELLQKKASDSLMSEATRDIYPDIQALRGGGQPLPRSERGFFETRFGADLSSVRVHKDVQAARAAQSVNARAFTLGRDVVFAAGEYAPDSFSGRKLLAHELTHVIQQTGGSGSAARSHDSNGPDRSASGTGLSTQSHNTRREAASVGGKQLNIRHLSSASGETISRADGDCPSGFELTWKCGLGVLGCIATVLAGIAASPTGIGAAAAILAVIAACGGAGTVCGELIGKYLRCRERQTVGGSLRAGLGAAAAAVENLDTTS